MKIIYSGNNYPIQVNDIDFEYLSKFKWNVNKELRVQCKVNGSTVQMSRLVADRMGLSLKHFIDHKDRNPLNNQRDNLRSATHSQNGMNREKYSNNTSGYKGVYWHKNRQIWCAKIQIDGKRTTIGYFNTAERAAEAYDSAAKRFHGEFANLNFPEDK